MKKYLSEKHLLKTSLLLGLLLGLLLQSCSYSKTYKLLAKGEFTTKNFTEELAFNYANNLILVDVEIEGETYTCILDSGAEVSLFDQKLLEKITHRKVARKNVKGAAGVKNKYQFLEIPKVKIGKLNFTGLGAVSSDLTLIRSKLKCHANIQGIIGNNLMRKAKWRIDYQKQKLWISDQLSSFDKLKDDVVIPLVCNEVGNVYLNTSLDGVEGRFTFDTGKTTKLKSNLRTFNTLKTQHKDLAYTDNKGILGITLNGIQYGTTNYTLIKELKIGDVSLKNQIVELEANEKSSSLIGNQIWENYIVTIDWDNCNLYLSLQQEIKADTFYKFQYNITTNATGDGFKLVNKWMQHSSDLTVNEDNEIISIEEVSVANLSPEAYCNFLEQELPKYKKQDQLVITLRSKGKEEKITLVKEKLLPK